MEFLERIMWPAAGYAETRLAERSHLNHRNTPGNKLASIKKSCISRCVTFCHASAASQHRHITQLLNRAD